jgi:hypothetical protein
MMPRSEDDIRAQYADLIGSEPDDSMTRLAQTLDAGYSLQRAPAGLRDNIPTRLPGATLTARTAGTDKHSPLRAAKVLMHHARISTSRPRWVHVSLAATLLLSLTAGIVLAVAAITNLGSPTNNLPPAPAPVLDGFARKGPVLKLAGKPEVLFIGTEVSGEGSATAVELWALVKALDQFGRFSGVGMAETQNCEGITTQTVKCFSPSAFDRGYAILDLAHARYTSRYLSFRHKDLTDLALHVQTKFSPIEMSLIQTYVRRYLNPPPSTWADFAWQESIQPSENRGLPLVSIGGYLRVDSGVALSGDLVPTTSAIPLPFSAVHDSLQSGKAVGGAPYSLVPDVNAEANVLTALMCHADGKKPASICNRSVIRTVLKRMK